MGTWLNLFAEYKDKTTHKWTYLDSIYFTADKNYEIYPILAGLQRHWMCDYNFTPISLPKGLPDNVSQFVKDNYADSGGADEVDCTSYLTLQEMIDYDWNQEITIEGVVDATNFMIFQKKGKPEFASESQVGGYTVSPKWMKSIVKGNDIPMPWSKKSDIALTVIQWKTTAKKEAHYLFKDVITPLKSRERKTKEETRIVFWFN